jgi:hypothetical protein
VKRRLAEQYSFLTSIARGGDVLPQQLSQLLPPMLRLAEETLVESAVYGEMAKVVTPALKLMFSCWFGRLGRWLWCQHVAHALP